MPYASANAGTRLCYEEAGRGTPIVFIHEFAGDYRSSEPQMRFFGRYSRCIAYNARGFPASDVPGEAARPLARRRRLRLRGRAGKQKEIPCRVRDGGGFL